MTRFHKVSLAAAEIVFFIGPPWGHRLAAPAWPGTPCGSRGGVDGVRVYVVVMGGCAQLRNRRGEADECHRRKACAGTPGPRHVLFLIRIFLELCGASLAESPLISQRQMSSC